MKKKYLAGSIVVFCLLLLLFFCFIIGRGKGDKGDKEVTKIQIPTETFRQEYYEEVHQAVKDNKKASRLISGRDTPTETAEEL